jgi:hypothetical protein
MIIGGFAAGVRHHVSEDQEIPEKYQKNTRKLYFPRKLKKPEGGGERSHRAGPPLAAPACGEATLAHYCHCLFTYIIIPKNLSERRAQR